MKLVNTALPLIVAVSAEDTLVRVKRDTFGLNIASADNNPSISKSDNESAATAFDNADTSDEFQCVYKDLYGFEYIWDEFAGDEEGCNEEKRFIFDLECREDCDEDKGECEEAAIEHCINAQFMQGRNGRKLGMKYYRWKAVARMVGHIVAKPTLKKKEVIKKLINYGCHCFPGGKKSRTVGGKGPAMDEIDGTCRTQYQCHKCVEMDTGCDPDNTPYKAQFKGKKNALVKDVICRDAEDSCGRAMCECDKRFAENLEKIWFNQGAHNGYYWKDRRNARKNPTFDYENTCLIPGNSPQPDTCCGNFPDVMPYNAATKDCCVQNQGPRLFDPMTHTCCAGGLIATAGSC
jgi:hypothetical protein